MRWMDWWGQESRRRRLINVVHKELQKYPYDFEMQQAILQAWLQLDDLIIKKMIICSNATIYIPPPIPQNRSRIDNSSGGV